MGVTNIPDELATGQRYWIRCAGPDNEFVDTVIQAGYRIKCIGVGNDDMHWYEIMDRWDGDSAG